MATPFISWTADHENEMQWLRELLIGMGFDSPIILGYAGAPRPPVDEIIEHMKKADCLFGLVAAAENTTNPKKMSEWVQLELNAAMLQKTPIGVLVDNPIEMPDAMKQAFTWRTVDLQDPKALLKATPGFIEQALKIKRLSEPEAGVRHPSVLDEVHVVNELARDKWRHFRSITLTAGPGFSSQCSHAVGVAMDKGAGISVKLADESRDLTVTSKDRPKLKVRIDRNDNRGVRYTVSFEPKVLPTETIRYRHVSVHPNIFPLTAAEVRERSTKQGSPAFMKDGLVGDSWEVQRRIDNLIIEIRAHPDLALKDPQLRVYVIDSEDEIEEERARIGSPRVAAHLWDVKQDRATEVWTCRVTIERPTIGWTYALLVRPTA